MHLQQREVFEGGGVEHHLGAMLGEHFDHAVRVPDVGHDEVAIVEQGPPLQPQLQAVERGLVPVEHDELVGSEAGELVTQLGADRAAGAGDQHAPTSQVAGDGLDVGVDDVTPEQVGFGQRSDVADSDGFTEEFAQRRQHEDAEVGGGGEVAQLTQQVGISAGYGDDDGVSMMFEGGAGDCFAATNDPEAAHAEVALGRIIIEEGNGEVRAGGVAQHGGDGLEPTLAGAEDQRPRRVLVGGAQHALLMKPPAVAGRTHHDEGDDTGSEECADGNDARAAGDVEGQQHRGGDGHGRHQMGDLVEGAEAPLAEVETESEAGNQLGAGGEEHGAEETEGGVSRPAAGAERIKADVHAGVEAQGPRGEVQTQLKEKSVADEWVDRPFFGDVSGGFAWQCVVSLLG